MFAEISSELFIFGLVALCGLIWVVMSMQAAAAKEQKKRDEETQRILRERNHDAKSDS